MRTVKCSYRLQLGRGCKVYICSLLDEEVRSETLTYEMSGFSKEEALANMNKRLNDFGYQAEYDR